MQKIKTSLQDVYIIEPDIFGDHRGWFCETWSVKNLEKLGIYCNFVQDNHSYTAKKGTIRGIHFQQKPMAQAKLVRVVRGVVMDVAVDLRKGSPTYMNWISVELSSKNKRQLFIPQGFGHGFVTLTDNVEFVYKCDSPYSKEFDRGIRFDDSNIGIDWDIENPILSDKDSKSPLLADSDCNFIYEEN